jgi:hypothetical protein
MEHLALFSGTLGLSPPWQVTGVAFAKGSNRLDITVEYEQLTPLTCPVCGAEGALRQEELEKETWFHADFFHYTTYLHAQVPHYPCRCRSFPRPWCRPGSRFCRIGEATPLHPADLGSVELPLRDAANTAVTSSGGRREGDSKDWLQGNYCLE